MPRTTTATEHKKPWPATVKHPQQAGCHSNPATRDGGMSGLGSEPAVLRTVCVLTRGGCSTFNKTPPHGHKTHLHITNGASHGGGGAETRGSYASEMFFAHKCSSFGNVREALKWNKGMNIGCIEYWPAGGVITWKTVSWPIFTPRLCSLCHRFPSEVWNFQQEVKVDSQSENSVTRLRLIHSQDQTGNSVYVFWNDTLRDKALRNGTYLQGIHTTHLHFDVEIHNWCFTLVEAFVMQEREDGQPKGGHMFEGKY